MSMYWVQLAWLGAPRMLTRRELARLLLVTDRNKITFRRM